MNKKLSTLIATTFAVVFGISYFAVSSSAEAVTLSIEEGSLVHDVPITTSSDSEITPFPSREKIISVTGTATTKVKPDFVNIQFGVETEEKTAKEALEANSMLMTAVVNSIKQVGITEDELGTSSLNIYPVYEGYQDEMTGIWKQELVGYRVSNILHVETKKLDLAASIIDNAVIAGVNRVDSVYFTLSPETQLMIKDDLIGQAVLNAKTKAEKALSPLDHKIIGVKAVSLSEFFIPPPVPFFQAAGAFEKSAADFSTPVFSSDQDVTTSANVVFLIGSN